MEDTSYSPMMEITVPYTDPFNEDSSVGGHAYFTISPDATLPEVFTAFGMALRAATFSDSTVKRWAEEHDLLDYLLL
jgi:hypothetical protein